MKNLIQFAPGLVAFGCELNLNTVLGEFTINKSPPDKEDILNAALNDIALFEDTSNFQDGAAHSYLAETIDGKRNPLSKSVRLNMLNVLGIMQGEKFILSVLQRDKVNRSWHISPEPNTCVYFGEQCYNRAQFDTSHRRGRKTERLPQEFHKMTSRGVSREQLVTPALNALYDNIPAAVTIPVRNEIILPTDENSLKEIPPDLLQELVYKAKKAMPK